MRLLLLDWDGSNHRHGSMTAELLSFHFSSAITHSLLISLILFLCPLSTLPLPASITLLRDERLTATPPYDRLQGTICAMWDTLSPAQTAFSSLQSASDKICVQRCLTLISFATSNNISSKLALSTELSHQNAFDKTLKAYNIWLCGSLFRS